MARFQRGVSGNPAGRRPGIADRRVRLLQELEADLPALIHRARDAALGGDTGALRLLLDRLLPLRKTVAERVKVPALAAAESLSGKAGAVLDAIAQGELPPDVGGSLINAISGVARIEEVAELRERLEALERVLKARNTP